MDLADSGGSTIESRDPLDPGRVASPSRERGGDRAGMLAYDLRFATDHFSGIGTHAFCLLQALLELPGPERYAVLWNPALTNTRFDIGPLRRHPRVTWFERSYAPLSPGGLLGVGRWLKQIRPSVYFSPFYLLPVAPGCPSVLTVHDVWPLRLPYGLEAWKRGLYRLLLRRATRARFMITSSEFSRREIGDLVRVDTGRIRVVRLGVPPARDAFDARRPARLPDGPFALVVGVNFPYKNLETLARAWNHLGSEAPLRLVAAGREDPRFPRLGSLAGERGISVLGPVGQSELEWLYANAVMLLFPTLYEGFGFPMVEAFVHGLPVVASDIPPLRELGNGSARFVDPRDEAAWASAVVELARDEPARRRMREAGLERAGQLTYRATAEATLAVLREAVAEERAA